MNISVPILSDFLEEEGLLADVETLAVKRVIAYQVEQLMMEQNLTKNEMSHHMNISRGELERLLDPSNPLITILTLGRAAYVLGKRLRITIT
jgi:predicted XRE-type DNA-binding protein